ncbi:GAF domain-containing protein [Deinococcus deserti]|uniref:histidine kinase n=1 Tax=Deinococcus deserti (strain DSM 17065 / CIP 109153 / LMG 22923 / VCD115) TaxID=546414 RepID=C1D494_DEIDV|nr:GAF domain-containing protein [Deinococcus deserti]ACO47975.2 putative histidine kinase, classic [Deinococcus deserti VCD115]
MPESFGASTAPSSLAERLQDVTEALAAATTPAAVFKIVLQPALVALDAVAGAVLLVSDAGDRLEIAATQGREDGAQTIWQDGPLDDTVPAGDALKQHTPLFFEHQGELTAVYPDLEERAGTTAPVASAVLPMFLDGQPLGAIVLDFKEPHHFTPAERRFLRTLAAQCAVALGRARLSGALHRQVEARTRELEESRARAEVLATLGDALQRAHSPEDVAVQALEPLGHTLGASSVMVVQLERGRLHVPTIWGETLPAMAALRTSGTPLKEAALLDRCARTKKAGYYADYDAAGGVLTGLATLAFAVEPIHASGDDLVGFLCAWRLPRTEPWPAGDRDLLRRSAGTLGVALERAVTTQALQERTEALDAFVAFTERVAGETDVRALIEHAADVLRATLGDLGVGYYEPEDGRWKARAWSNGIPREFVARMQAGFEFSTPRFAHAIRDQQPHFMQEWNSASEDLPGARRTGAMATYPYFQHGRPTGVLSAGSMQTLGWSEREQAIIRAVGRSLGLAMEGTRSAAELRRASRFNELVLNSLGEGVTTIDAQGRSTLANPAALKMLGYTAEDFMGRPQHALIHHSYPDGSPFPREACEIYAAFVDGQVHRANDEVFWRKDGSSFPVEYTSTPILNESGEIEGSVLVFRDVTERQRAEATLRQANDELRRSNAELEQFAYVASHDLQEPLRTVTSFSQLLAKKYAGQTDARGQMYVRLITEGTQRMTQLLQDLLAFSRVAKGAADPVRVNTGVILAQVSQDLAAQIQHTGAQLHIGEVPDVLGDASQLRQLFQNLIGNALKFSHPERGPVVWVGAECDGGLVRFRVQDNGVGIAPEYFERIFTIFQRLHTREQYEGSGIGLSIARKIVERHGGRIWLESTPALGTTFYFTLPAVEGGA